MTGTSGSPAQPRHDLWQPSSFAVGLSRLLDPSPADVQWLTRADASKLRACRRGPKSSSPSENVLVQLKKTSREIERDREGERKRKRGGLCGKSRSYVCSQGRGGDEKNRGIREYCSCAPPALNFTPQLSSAPKGIFRLSKGPSPFLCKALSTDPKKGGHKFTDLRFPGQSLQPHLSFARPKHSDPTSSSILFLVRPALLCPALPALSCNGGRE